MGTLVCVGLTVSVAEGACVGDWVKLEVGGAGRGVLLTLGVALELGVAVMLGVLLPV
jgi:hypothetical protein